MVAGFLSSSSMTSHASKGITSETPEPTHDECVYVYVGGSNDTITLTATLNPSADPSELEGCIAWSGAEQSEDNPLAAEFPISSPSSSIQGTIVRFSCGSSQVAIRIVVVAINLSYNGLPEETEEVANEEVPGGFIIREIRDGHGVNT